MQHNLRDPSRDRDAWPDLPRHLRRPAAAEAGQDRRRADREAARPAQGAGRPRPLPRPHRAGRPRQRRGHRRGARSGSAALDKNDPDYEHHLLEALWLHQYHNVVNVDLLKQMLDSPDFRARAAATRVLCYWRDRVPDALELLKKLAADPHPRVRLEAVRAASFFTVPEAVEVAADRRRAADRSLPRFRPRRDDEGARSVSGRRRSPRASRSTSPPTPAARYFLKNVSTDDLLKMKRTPAVYLELLFRKGVRDEFRREALTGLAKLEGQERTGSPARRHPQPGRQQGHGRTKASSSIWSAC